jgi:hypothetical protein
MNYPNREHQNADQAATRRALHCLDGIESDVTILRRRLTQTGSTVSVDGADSGGLALRVRDLTEYLTVLETLRDVREWHALDQRDAEAGKP